MNPIYMLMSPESRQIYHRLAPLFGNALKTLYHEMRRRQTPITIDQVSNKWRQYLQENFINEEEYWIDETVFSKQKNHLGEEFRNTICLSANNCVAHGKNKNILEPGDLVTFDAGITAPLLVNRRLVFDSAVTCVIGSEELPEVARASLNALKEIRTLSGAIGVRDIAEVIQRHAWEKELSVVTALAGHGIGYTLHEYPGIPNAVFEKTTIKLPKHIMVNPEPMYVEGDGKKVAPVYIDDDGWSVITTGPSAHWETTYYYDGNNLHDIVGITDIA